ncbi:MAG: hypothetical protein HS127_10280 [Planctomycetia bacterium]|nr:hypothetical protein [Planctomycetia bacterium]
MEYTLIKTDDHWFRQNINCQYACPVNTPAMNYIELIAEENFDASLNLNFMANLFPLFSEGFAPILRNRVQERSN